MVYSNSVISDVDTDEKRRPTKKPITLNLNGKYQRELTGILYSRYFLASLLTRPRNKLSSVSVPPHLAYSKGFGRKTSRKWCNVSLLLLL